MKKVLLVSFFLGLVVLTWWMFRGPDPLETDAPTPRPSVDATSRIRSESSFDVRAEELEPDPTANGEATPGPDASSGPVNRESPPGTGVRVEGQVVDVGTGAPVEGARLEFVQSRPDSRRVVHSGPGGVFELDGCNEGRLVVEAAGRDYPKQLIKVQLVPGTNRLDLRLDPGVQLEIEVLDLETRAPVPGASVTDAGRGRPFGVTGEDGRIPVTALIERIVDPQIDLCVVATGYCGVRRVLNDPGQLRQGQVLRFLLPRAVVVRGTVRDGAGSPVEGVVIRALGASVWSRSLKKVSPRVYEGLLEERITSYTRHPSATTDPSGAYRLEGVLVGVADLQLGVYHDSFVPQEPPVLPGVRYPGEILDLDITVRAAGRIVGRVFVNDVRCRAVLTWEGGGRSGRGYSDDQGNFEIHGVEPGRVVVSVIPPGFETAVAPAGSETVEVKAGRTARCELRVTTPHQLISGRVSNARGAPLSGLRVLAIGVAEETRDEAFRAHGTTDPEGRYSLAVPDRSGLRYRVYLYHGRGLTMGRENITPGAENVDFEVPDVGRVPVTVFDVERQAPITSFEIEARSTDGARHWAEAGESSFLLRADWVFDLELPVGTYDLVIRSPDRALRTARISGVPVTREGRRDPLEVRLRKKVEVTIEWGGDPDRFPLEGRYRLLLQGVDPDDYKNRVEVDRPRGSRLIRLDPGEYRLHASPEDIVFEPSSILVPDGDEAFVRLSWRFPE